MLGVKKVKSKAVLLPKRYCARLSRSGQITQIQCISRSGRSGRSGRLGRSGCLVQDLVQVHRSGA